MGREVPVQASRELGFLVYGRKEARLQTEATQWDGLLECAVDLSKRRRPQVVCVFPASQLLLGSKIVEGPIALDSPAERNPGSKPAFIRFVRRELKWRRSVQGSILHEEKGVSMRPVQTGSGLHIDGPASRPARLGRKAMVDDLEVADRLGRKLCSAAAQVFIVVAHAVNADCFAGRTKAAEAEGDVGLIPGLLSDGGVSRRRLWRERNEGEIVAVRNRQFLYAVPVDVDHR